MNPFLYHSNGKLLLTSEYVVLDGAKAIALPTKKGQSLEIEKHAGKGIIEWTSYDENADLWFQSKFTLKKVIETENNKIGDKLLTIFKSIEKLKPDFFSNKMNYTVSSELDFNKDWGWGSSSTLINNLAKWAEVDPFVLLKKTFGGSGYDLACASSNSPISFQLKNNTQEIKPLLYSPTFKDELYFVYLEKKQNSREAMSYYQKIKKSSDTIGFFNNLTDEIVKNQSDIAIFSDLINLHEENMSSLLGMPSVKKDKFSDYPNSIKSLGAWGGDFILAVGKEALDYFPNKNYPTVLRWDDVVLQQTQQL